MLSCAPGAGECSVTSGCGTLPAGRLPRHRLLQAQRILRRGPYSSSCRGRIVEDGTPPSMHGNSHHSFLMCVNKSRTSPSVGVNPRWSPKASLTSMLCLLAVLLSPPCAHCQEQEDIKGAPAEPTDAQEIREQIAAVEKLRPMLPDRGAALYFLAAAKQHLGETREALALLKECIVLQEGFDPSGEPA